MSFEPTIEEQELLEDTFASEHATMSRREMTVGSLLGVALFAAVALLWLIAPVTSIDALPAALSVLVLVLAGRVSFDTSFGFTGLTQLAFVPLVFSMPPAAVPLAVALALALARVPDALRGEIPASRLLQAAGNSWFAVGPAAVFVVSGTAPIDSGPALLIGALGAQFIADFAASSLRFWLSRDASFAMQLRETWVYLIDAALSGVALVVARHVHSEPAGVLAIVPLLGLFALLARERRQRLESLLELNNAYRGTALVLGDVVEADDGYTGEHCKSVLVLALEVAERLGLEESERRNLEFAALLHDVGKIAVPKQIVNKPGKLDEGEWEIIRTHTIEGQRILERVGGFMREVGLVVRSHHERWDGTGYPDRLAREQIPYGARIIAACDTWNAMRTDRSYRRALSYEVAMTELLACSGTQLDPHVVEVLVAVIEGGEAAEDQRPASPRSHSRLLVSSGDGAR
jgi:putative nucleotidyltransferase with HDIG domain